MWLEAGRARQRTACCCCCHACTAAPLNHCALRLPLVLLCCVVALHTPLQTFKNGSTITVESNTGGTIKLAGAGSSADITQKDIYACKVGGRAGGRAFGCWS